MSVCRHELMNWGEFNPNLPPAIPTLLFIVHIQGITNTVNRASHSVVVCYIGAAGSV